MKLFLIFLLSTTFSLAQDRECPSRTRRVIDPSFRPRIINMIKVAFFDADSTLRVSLQGAVSPNTPRDVKLLPYMTKKINDLKNQGYLIYVVSNQGGVEDKIINCATADGALKYAVDLIRAEGAIIHGYDFAEFKNRDRKPDIGMASKLEKILKNKFGSTAQIDKQQSIMVGDSAYKKQIDITPEGKLGTHFSNSDRLFAENLGISFLEPAVFFGWREFGIDVFTTPAQVDRFISFCERNVKCASKLKAKAISVTVPRRRL
jgi:DNA 3'-phosphatase